jgi:hypothetical protein
VNRLLQARLDFVIYSIGIDLASLGCWGWSAPKGSLNPIDSHKSMYYTVHCKVNNDHHGGLLLLGKVQRGEPRPPEDI